MPPPDPPPKPPVTKLIEKGTHFLICKVKTGVETSFWQRDLSNQPQEAPPCGKQGGVEQLWLKRGERPEPGAPSSVLASDALLGNLEPWEKAGLGVGLSESGWLAAYLSVEF